MTPGQIAMEIDVLPPQPCPAYAVLSSVRPGAVGRPVETVALVGGHLAGCVRCQREHNECICRDLFAEADALESRGQAQWQKRAAAKRGAA